MIANKNRSFLKLHHAERLNDQRGAGILEILLVMAIVALLTPFLYNQISETSRDIHNISIAKQVIKTRDSALNFVRINQDTWPDVAQIKLTRDELEQITDFASSGFIDKYIIQDAVITDIYLSFDFDDDALRSAKIAEHIGADAASVDKDGIAYGSSWAVAAPDFKPGDLVYRINYKFGDDNISKYLHLGTYGEDDLNAMKRTLNMGNFDIYDIGTISGESGKVTDSYAVFTEAKEMASSLTYFVNGANMNGDDVTIDSMRISGDITGFRNIYANKINDDDFTTKGAIITDRATVTNSVNVGKDMIVKSETSKTIGGFSGIIAHSLFTSFIYSDEIRFYNNFGLTVSGELMMSTNPPLEIGDWLFPSITPPSFSEFELGRAQTPNMPNISEFNKLMQTDWKE